MILPFLLAVLVQDAPITKDAQRAIAEIQEGNSPAGGLFKLFGDDYVPSLDWEAGLIPALLESLKIDNHSVQFSIDRVWHKITGFEIFGIAGGTFETLAPASKQKALDWLQKWWDKYKDRSRIDWFLDALESASLKFRRAGIERLSMLFNKSFGYEAEGDAAGRAKAVEAWRAWWPKAKPIAKWDAHQACYTVDEKKFDPAEQRRIADQVRGWIEQLAAADVEVREAATERLIEAGAIASEALKEALKSNDAEMRGRSQLVLDAQAAVLKRKDVAERAARILATGDVAGEIELLAAQRDVLSAMVIVEVCAQRGPAGHGRPAAKRAAEDAAIAWAFARHVRRTTAEAWQGERAHWATDSTRALFGESAAKLVPYLKDPSPRVRMAAAAVAASLGTKHLADVKTALGDADQRVRMSAVMALGQCGERSASDALIDHLKVEKDWDCRRWTVVSIGRLRDERKLDALVSVAIDPKEHLFVAGAAAEAVGLIQHAKGIESLRKILEVRIADLKEKKDDYSRRYVVNYVCASAVQIALANADDAGSWKWLEGLLVNETVALRELTVQALAYAEPRQASQARVRELLQAASKDADAKVQQHATVGLRRWK